MPRFIYFVGRPYPIKDALDSVRDQGYRIGLFQDKNVPVSHPESYDDIVKLDFSSPQTIESGLIGRNLAIDGLMCTYENYILAKSWLANHFQLPAPSTDSAKMSTDKFLMREAFKKTSPDITPSFDLASSEEAILKLAEELGYPLILKPTNLVKSLLVLKCNDQHELLKNFAYAKQHIVELYSKNHVYEQQPQLILEEYIDGQTCSIAAFIDKAGKPHFCEGIVSLSNAQDIKIDDNYIYGRFLPAEFDSKLEERLFSVARQGIEALKLSSSPAHVELIYNQEGVKLIEIGARIGGYRPRMYQVSYGLDLIAQEVKPAVGQSPDLDGKFQAYSAVFELFPKSQGEFIGIENEPDISQFRYYRIKAKKGETIGPAKNGYKAAAVVMVGTANQREFDGLCEQVNRMRVRIKG